MYIYMHLYSKCDLPLVVYNCRDEREKYAKHRHKAEKYPSKYLSLIIDGMDQEKTNIPHILSNPKSMAGAYTLETHVTGVQVHCNKGLYTGIHLKYSACRYMVATH